MGGLNITPSETSYFRTVAWRSRGLLDFDDAWAEAQIQIWEAQKRFDARGLMNLRQYTVRRIKWRLWKLNDQLKEEGHEGSIWALEENHRGGHDRTFEDTGMLEFSETPDHDYDLDARTLARDIDWELDEREKVVLQAVLDGHTITSAAQDLGVCRERGRQILVGLMAKIEKCKTKLERSTIKVRPLSPSSLESGLATA